VGERDRTSKGSKGRGPLPERQEDIAVAAATESDAAWIELMPTRHFVMAEQLERRCAMCNKPIKAGERYFGSRTVDYAAVVRFHRGCGEEYARKMPRA
jgi:hypothetical protein